MSVTPAFHRSCHARYRRKVTTVRLGSCEMTRGVKCHAPHGIQSHQEGNQRRHPKSSRVSSETAIARAAFNQRPSRGHQKGRLRGHHTSDIQYPSCTSSSRRPEPISGNQWQSAAISGNQRQSVAISGNQWQSACTHLRHPIPQLHVVVDAARSRPLIRPRLPLAQGPGLCHVAREERAAHDGARRRGAHQHQRTFGKGDRPSTRVERVGVRARRGAVAPALFAARA